MFNQIITIYNKRYDAATRQTLWPKTVISGVSWAGQQRVTTGEGLTSNNGYSVRIPVPAMAVAGAYPDWCPDTDYACGVIVKYAGDLYEVIQDHCSQSDWPPTITPSLYMLIGGFAKESPVASLRVVYLSQDEYQALDDPSGYWTAQTGDVVMLGAGPDVSDSITEVTKQHTESFVVIAVHTANLQRLLPHLRIEGK